MNTIIKPPVTTLEQFFAGANFNVTPRWSWPFKNFRGTVTGLARHFALTSLCEVGGGRIPLLQQETVGELGADYAICDISQAELDRAPGWLSKVQCDIGASDLQGLKRNQYDLMFSHMVMEHVRDVRQAYVNTFQLLREDGIVINFHPTLYALPFVVNRMAPEDLTRPLLQLLDKSRDDTGRPKFPAYYSWCVSTARAERMIRAIGFREVFILPFWGHAYFDRVPLLRDLGRTMAAAAESRQIRSLSSYAYTIARK